MTAIVLEPRDQLRGWLGRSCRWLRSAIVGAEGASRAVGRPAPRAGLVAVDRRRGRLRPGQTGGETASNQAGHRCLRSMAARQGPGEQQTLVVWSLSSATN